MEKINFNELVNAADYWKGKESLIAMEECGELLQVLSKIERKGMTDDLNKNLKEEIRDVAIVLNIIAINQGFDGDEIVDMINKKLNKNMPN